jgi:hypothetical protein
MTVSINMMVNKDSIEMEIKEHDGQCWQEKIKRVELPIAEAKDLYAALGRAIEKNAREIA